MLGGRTARVTGLVALLLTGAALLGPFAGATTRPPAPDGADGSTRVRDSCDRTRDHVLDHDGESAALGSDSADDGAGVSTRVRDSHDRTRDHVLDHDGEPAAPGPDSAGPDSGPFGGTPAPVTGQSSGEPSVGGAQATTDGADGSEALVASTAPTPPNGAEPPAAVSPGAADTSPAATVAVVDAPTDAAAAPATGPAATPPAPDSGLLDDFDGVIDATGPKPLAAGLSADTTRPGVLVALLAFVVLLFLVGYQLVDRRDPRREATRDAEAVARFR